MFNKSTGRVAALAAVLGAISLPLMGLAGSAGAPAGSGCGPSADRE